MSPGEIWKYKKVGELVGVLKVGPMGFVAKKIELLKYCKDDKWLVLITEPIEPGREVKCKLTGSEIYKYFVRA